MNTQGCSRLPAFFCLLASPLIFAANAGAAVRVGGYALRANGQAAEGFQYTGACPVNLQFAWGVVGADPATVTYTLTRSDGAGPSGVQSVSMSGGRSVPVYMNWRLGDNNPAFANYSGWAQLNIESPNRASQKVPFTIHCSGGSPAGGTGMPIGMGPGAGGTTVRIGGWSLRANGQVAQGFQYSGGCPVSLKFGWSVLGATPTTVSYTVDRSDGGHSMSARILDLPVANRSGFIYEDWTLGSNTSAYANFSGWAQLNVQSPNPASQRVPFTLLCHGSSSMYGASTAGNSSAGAATSGYFGNSGSSYFGNTGPGYGGTANSSSSGLRIGGWSLRVNGQEARDFRYTGACPVDLQFGWSLMSTTSADVTYSFSRSDGGRGMGMSLQLAPNRAAPIYMDWRIGEFNTHAPAYQGWAELDVDSPTRLSQKVPFTVRCR